MREATDLGISASVRRELAGRRIDLSKIKFPVMAGVVTLQGELCFVGIDKTSDETAVELKFIESGIKMLSGVKGLVFELTNWSKNEAGLWECLVEGHSASPIATASGAAAAMTSEGIVCSDCDYVIRFCPCCGKPLAGAHNRSANKATRRTPPPVRPVLKKKKPFVAPTPSVTDTPTHPGLADEIAIPEIKPAPAIPVANPSVVSPVMPQKPVIPAQAVPPEPVAPIEPPVSIPQPPAAEIIPDAIIKPEIIPIIQEPEAPMADANEFSDLSLDPPVNINNQLPPENLACVEENKVDSDIFSDLLSAKDPEPEPISAQTENPASTAGNESGFSLDNLVGAAQDEPSPLPADDGIAAPENIPVAFDPFVDLSPEPGLEPLQTPDADTYADDNENLLPPMKPAQQTQAPLDLTDMDIDETPLPPMKPASTPTPIATPTPPPDANPLDAFSFEDDDTPLPPMKPKAPEPKEKKDPFAALFSEAESNLGLSQEKPAPGKDPFSSLDLDLDVLEIFPQNDGPSAPMPAAPKPAPPSAPPVDDNPFNLDNVIDLDTPVEKDGKSDGKKDPFDLDDFDISKFKL